MRQSSKIWLNIKTLLVVFILVILAVIGYFLVIFGLITIIAIVLFFIIRLFLYDPDEEEDNIDSKE